MVTRGVIWPIEALSNPCRLNNRRALMAGAQVVHTYLSHQHFEDLDNSCPLVALPTDVARSGVYVEPAFETVFRAMLDVLARSLRGKKRPRRSTAQAIAALSIGGMVVARRLVDRTQADELRAACLGAALRLGGWEGLGSPRKKPAHVARKSR
jgi:hypothetical protein